jgi:hypothetical protein
MPPISPENDNLPTAQALAPSLTSFSSTTALTASFIIDRSWSLSTPDTWFFDRFLNAEELPMLSIGDIITVYRHAPDGSFLPLPLPAFTGRLKRIVGWSSSRIVFQVCEGPCTAHHEFPFPPTIIHIPSSVIRLSFPQRLWGTLFPFPRAFEFPQRPAFDLMPKEHNIPPSSKSSISIHQDATKDSIPIPCSVPQACSTQPPAGIAFTTALGTIGHGAQRDSDTQPPEA